MNKSGSPAGEKSTEALANKKGKNTAYYSFIAPDAAKDNILSVQPEERARSCSPRLITTELPTKTPKEAKKSVQTGMDRYINIPKRKLSPEKANGNNAKSIKISANDKNERLKNNKFAILQDVSEENSQKESVNNAKKFKPPPIYLREKNSNELVTAIISLVGKNNFHVVPLRKGNIDETKIQIYSENHYRAVSKFLSENKKNFYTYQLKSSKGVVVVIKGIEPSVKTDEVKEALEEEGFAVKFVTNIFNKNKIPQPMFKVEVASENLKKNATHPIYGLRYLLHRRVTVEEPLKRNGPVQCSNCQEFGHTKTYCTLRTVCVICGDLHHSKECPKTKSDTNAKKCSNCGGNHTANYRGCPIYKELKNKLTQRKYTLKMQPEPTMIISTNEASTSTKATPNISYANVVKSNVDQSQHAVPPSSSGIETMMLNLIQLMTNLQSSIEELARTQTQMLQVLLAQK